MDLVDHAKSAALAVAMSFAACTSHGAGAPAPACTPKPPSASDSFATDRAPQSPEVALAKSIADRYVAEHPPSSLGWDWGEGVLMASMVTLYRVSGDAAYRDYYRAWLDGHLAQGYQITNSDTCTPAITAVALYSATCDSKYRGVATDVFDYLDHTALRTDDGGISHLGALTAFGPTLWIDSLYMFGDVLVRWGDATGDGSRLDLFASQYMVFAKDLQDGASGWFTHGYHWISAQDPNVYWGRGNGWVVASGADYLSVRASRGETDDAVRASWSKLAAAVVAAQDPATGLYWTVVNRPGETYLESSATALFAFGLARARRAGAIDASVLPTIEKAIAGLRTKITVDPQGRPVVTGISGPTMVGQFKDYAAVSVEDDLTYGVGAVIMALVEASGLR
jgi:unsaturated rhamnogalacturonyl hydrolase